MPVFAFEFSLISTYGTWTSRIFHTKKQSILSFKGVNTLNLQNSPIIKSFSAVIVHVNGLCNHTNSCIRLSVVVDTNCQQQSCILKTKAFHKVCITTYSRFENVLWIHPIWCLYLETNSVMFPIKCVTFGMITPKSRILLLFILVSLC